MKQLAIYSSGTGTNAARIINYFRYHPTIKVSLIVCNKPGAGVLDIASAEGLPVLMIDKEVFFRGDAYVEELRRQKIDFLVLAGFLWKIPLLLVQAYRGRIINIHPALLPKYGGKGMYGLHVHESVIDAGEKESGITIHYVDELYDHGQAIFQARVTIGQGDTAAMLAAKIRGLEHEHFPRVIEEVVTAVANLSNQR